MRRNSVPDAGAAFHFDVLLRFAAPPLMVTPMIMNPAVVQPLTILLAEDNPTNRLIATRLLERMGHAVESATDGRLALEAARTRDFDVILVDPMMPELDGIATTEAIRALDGPRDQVPIIGLTANATRYDETICLAAGMNGFATKPITAERLAAAIGAVLPRAMPPGRPPDTHHAVPLLDLMALEGLCRGIGTAILAEILNLYLDGAGNQIAALGAARAEPALFRECAHAITGSAGNVGLKRLGAMAAELERAARAGDVEPAAFGRIAALHAESVAALRVFNAQLTVPIGWPPVLLHPAGTRAEALR